MSAISNSLPTEVTRHLTVDNDKLTLVFFSDLTDNIGSIRHDGRAPKTMDIAVANSVVGVNRFLRLRPSLSDRCMDYHVLIWKIKITASETGAPPVIKKLISDD